MLNNQKQKRFDQFLWSLFCGLLLFAGLLLSLSSCKTYSGFLRKFGHVGKDSTVVTVNDTLMTLKDSVSLVLKTDTTTIHRIIEHGKARIIYDRTKEITRIQAECKPDTVIRKIKVKGPPIATFGIAPWYRWAFYLTLGLLAVAVISYIFLYKLRLSIAKRPQMVYETNSSQRYDQLAQIISSIPNQIPNGTDNQS